MVKDLWTKVTDGYRVFVIAEAGVNHNGDTHRAKRLIDVAVRAGADAVKFQTFNVERMVSCFAPKAKYQTANTRFAESQMEMLRHLELSQAAHKELYAYCRNKNILFLSSPFDEESADFLFDLGVEMFKIPSGEMTNIPFLRHVARKERPVILSTGMSTLQEVKAAFKAIKGAGNSKIVLLHCVSAYPTKPKDANLKAMRTMAKKFKVPVGYSDHTLGVEIALAAAALGACVIEKHFTLSHTLAGPDHKMSLDPGQLTSLIEGIRKIEVALGHGRKEPVRAEQSTADVARKSLVAARDIRKGTVLSGALIAIKRPGTGLAPGQRNALVGRKAKTDISKDKLISWDMVK